VLKPKKPVLILISIYISINQEILHNRRSYFFD
jgi:hypothetical protein